MALQVVISDRAEKNLDKIVSYLEHKFSKRVKQNFLTKLSKTIKLLTNNPQMYPASKEKKNIRKCVVTKYTTLFYKVNETAIEIITIQDSRQNPVLLNL